MRSSSRGRAALLAAVVAVGVALVPGASSADAGWLTAAGSMLTLDASAPAGSSVVPIVNSGEEPVSGFTFEGIPDGIGAMPGSAPGTVDVFVNHEQSRVPFPPTLSDFVDASVSRLTLDAATGAVLDASVALAPEEGLIRLCSATMAGPDEGLSRYLFMTGEESNDRIAVPADAGYGPDPSIAPLRQAGYAVLLDPATGESRVIPGMGRHNHENAMVVPGGWDELAVLSGDDTFNAPSSQLYLYLADDEDALWNDEGSLWAFRVTATQDGKVDAADAFNGANDYGDIGTGDTFEGRFIRVPKKVAEGTTALAPQEALEAWSNENNVFQFIRIEDTAYDPNDPTVVYLADTGERRAVEDPATGRLRRSGSAGPFGPYVNGRIFRMAFDADNPRKASLSILLNADEGRPAGFTPMHQPDNMGTSANSLMVQEDSGQAPFSRVWRYDFSAETWSVVASTNDQTWESSGIVDVSAWFGPGSWLLDVQAHNVFVDGPTPDPDRPGVSMKREGGQLLLLRVPGS